LQTWPSRGKPLPARGDVRYVSLHVNFFVGENFALGSTGEVAFTNQVQTGGGFVFGAFRFRSDNLLEKFFVRAM